MFRGEYVRRGALCRRHPVGSKQGPAIGSDRGCEEDVGAGEGPVVSRGEFVGEEDGFSDSARWGDRNGGSILVHLRHCRYFLVSGWGGGDLLTHVAWEKEGRTYLLPPENWTARSSCKVLKSENR